MNGRGSLGQNDIHVEPNQLRGELGEPLDVPLRRTMLDHEAFSLDVPAVSQVLKGQLEKGIAPRVWTPGRGAHEDG